MIIHLGLHLDGQRGYRPANRLGEVTVGPAGLLGILELRLGISYGDSCTAERIVQYRDCLKRCDLEQRFYHRTFEADELGTAATLLGWRDLWHLHGWNGAFDASASGKLKDIGEMEVLAKESVHTSVGERLSAVLDGLSRRSAGIEKIWLLDPLSIFPKRWRDVLAILPIRTELPDSMTGEPGRGPEQPSKLLSRPGMRVSSSSNL